MPNIWLINNKSKVTKAINSTDKVDKLIDNQR